MTWHRSGTTWQLMRDGEPVDELRWDAAQRTYVDAKGARLSRNFDDARRICEGRIEKRGKDRFHGKVAPDAAKVP